ncbi:response regulator [Patescibacteria group bacterium]|nr:response regulator [Patescibacteria group bacterium]
MKDGNIVVLIVEDDPSNQLLLKTAIELITKEVVILQVTTIKEASEIFHRDRNIIDKILMDGELPDGTSINLVKEIRKTFNGDIIAFSGAINDELMKSGCNKKLSKPFNMKDLKNLFTE